jgi:DNA repair protein RadB
MDLRIKTGCEVIDLLIKGIESNIITTIYGPSGSGKSNLCLMVASHLAREKKVIYVDTEGGFSVERLKQLNPELEIVLDNIILMQPTNFEDQRKAVRMLKELATDKIGLIIIDTLTMLYRVELGTQEETFAANRELGKQIVLLSEIARKKNIPVLITNQVYANFENSGVTMVGGTLIKYGSKCILELKKHKSFRSLILKKHRSLPEKIVNFRIINSGVEIIDLRKEKEIEEEFTQY